MALALDSGAHRLYVANIASDAVAVIDTAKLTAGASKSGFVEPNGFVPTEWLPFSIAFSGGKLYLATAKGHGTGPNNMPQRRAPDEINGRTSRSTYIATLLYGSFACLTPPTSIRTCASSPRPFSSPIA